MDKLNAYIKRHGVANWHRKLNPEFICMQETIWLLTEMAGEKGTLISYWWECH